MDEKAKGISAAVAGQMTGIANFHNITGTQMIFANNTDDLNCYFRVEETRAYISCIESKRSEVAKCVWAVVGDRRFSVPVAQEHEKGALVPPHTTVRTYSGEIAWDGKTGDVSIENGKCEP